MKWLVTGGVGFIGTNLVVHLIEQGHEVDVVDDFSRDGVGKNAELLKQRFGINPVVIDVAETNTLNQFLDKQPLYDVVAHLAGQVSFLESIDDPMRDFLVNAQGTLNLLNFIRTRSPETLIIGMSSNKIYGDLDQVAIREDQTRFVAPDWPQGFDESLPLQFHGPYGCSKGAVDQYLADFARTYGLRTASLRQSSVYGPHQHPRSDQGWVAHLVSEALNNREIKLNGVGKQVRDLLHATDLARLFVALAESVKPGAVNQFNVGGGSANAMSILELFSWLETTSGKKVKFQTGVERQSDQKVFISDNSAVTKLTGWKPSVDLDSGLNELIEFEGRS